MPAAARLNDPDTGHGCFGATPITAGSGDVSINGMPAARMGDPLAMHGCGVCSPHARAIAAGSATVSINGMAAARLDDAVDCGGTIAAGSGNVFIGDSGMGGPFATCAKKAFESVSAYILPNPEPRPEPRQSKRAAALRSAAKRKLPFCEECVDTPVSKQLFTGKNAGA